MNIAANGWILPCVYRQYGKTLWQCYKLAIRPCHHCPWNHVRCIQTSATQYKYVFKKNPELPKRDRRKKGSGKQVISIYKSMKVRDLAEALNVPSEDVSKLLKKEVKHDHRVSSSKTFNDDDTIDHLHLGSKVVSHYNMKFSFTNDHERHDVEETVSDDSDVVHHRDIQRQGPADPKELQPRPPIVTIMGHVDHGKTTLLDALRETRVVDQEFGGITQHIGAFQVKLSGGEKITFLDTPGHAAFSAMRARGASVTDIIVLVVAAEDGVMQQTLESINLAKNENVPIIVAINKIDKASKRDIEKVKVMLASNGVMVEDMGGEVQAVPISALKRTNLDMLQESIVTQSEFMELKGDPVGKVEGTVIEARTDKGRGRLTTIVVQRGTLKRGDLLVAGTAWSKVRAIYNDQGQSIDFAPPAMPVEIIGWKELPTAGDEVLQAMSEKEMKDAVAFRQEKIKLKKQSEDWEVIKKKREKDFKDYKEGLEEKRQHMHTRRTPLYLFQKINKGIVHKEYDKVVTKPEISIIVKGDVDGSVEAIIQTLATFRSNFCTLDIISYGVGEVTEHDIKMAEPFDSAIFAFNVGVDVNATLMKHSVPIVHNNVIYSLFDDLITFINSRLPTVHEKEVVGEAKVQEIFTIGVKRAKIPVAGCRCVHGVIKKNLQCYVERNGAVVYEGAFESLKHHKDEVESIKKDMECGIRVDSNTFVYEPNDKIVCYKMVEREQYVEWSPDY